MESLRRYVTNTELEERGIAAPETFKIIEAERDIDTVVKTFYEGPLSPFFDWLDYFDSVVFTTTNATLPQTFEQNYFTYTVIEITSGANTGLVIPIASSNGTVVTFASTQSITPGTYSAKIYQEGKFPRLAESNNQNNVWHKTIPQWLKDCVAYQYSFRLNNAALFNNASPLSSYRVDGDSYSETFDTNSSFSYTKENRISPDALAILSSRGMLGTSI